MFSPIFCAVPALRRVEPAITSGPTTGAIIMSTCPASALGWLQASPTVRACCARAWASAASTYGVWPLAEMPTTASRAVISWRCARAAAINILAGGIRLLRRRQRPRGWLQMVWHASAPFAPSGGVYFTVNRQVDKRNCARSGKQVVALEVRVKGVLIAAIYRLRVLD